MALNYIHVNNNFAIAQAGEFQSTRSIRDRFLGPSDTRGKTIRETATRRNQYGCCLKWSAARYTAAKIQEHYYIL